MIKTFTLFFMLTTLAEIVHAQPSLNTFPVPVFESKVQINSISTNVPAVGNAGANQTWDFSAVDFSKGGSGINTWTTPASTANGSKFPDATIAEVSSSGNVNYNIMTSTKQATLGTLQSGTLTTYSKPYLYATAPFAYNTTQYSDYISSFPYGPYYTVLTTGTVATTYDGYGTLKTSNGTFTNVIRLKAVVNEKMVIDYGNDTKVTYTNDGIVYQWILADRFFPLFAISANTSGIGGSPYTTITNLALLYDPIIATSLTHPSTQSVHLSVGPNPATDLLTIDFTDLESGNYEVEILNELGALQYTEQFYAAKGSLHPFDISYYTNGLYILKIKTPSGMGMKKFIKS